MDPNKRGVLKGTSERCKCQENTYLYHNVYHYNLANIYICSGLYYLDRSHCSHRGNYCTHLYLNTHWKLNKTHLVYMFLSLKYVSEG